MVGYVMVIYDYDAEEYNIWHMMIDEKYQGKGYGKAIGLYRSFGFVPTGGQDEDEIELVLMI